jgi:hypothetical protein
MANLTKTIYGNVIIIPLPILKMKMEKVLITLMNDKYPEHENNQAVLNRLKKIFCEINSSEPIECVRIFQKLVDTTFNSILEYYYDYFEVLMIFVSMDNGDLINLYKLDDGLINEVKNCKSDVYSFMNVR